MGRGRLGLPGLVAVIAASAWALLAAGAAQASTITVGSVLPPGSTATKFDQVATLFNTALPEKGASLVSPVNGTIVRWRVQDAKGGPFYLRVLRPNEPAPLPARGPATRRPRPDPACRPSPPTCRSRPAI
ncbi:MAG TPA: hypothetical protein VHQ43_01965 [Solirubrobacterales bacterium]|jgi:hypothetical protein|nr:hypothetical protein [Solirubrobacterales bacterium]